MEANGLARVARGAAEDAGGLDAALLGDFLEVTAAAAHGGQRLRRRELQGYADQGREAAAAGVALRALVDLYLSAAWRLWRELPLLTDLPPDLPGPAAAARVHAAGLAVLRCADDAVQALVEGFQLARNELARRQEAERRDVFEALLAGGGRATEVVGRAADLGLDLSSPTAVLVAAPLHEGVPPAAPLLGRVESALAGRRGDAAPLVSVRDGNLVCVVAAPDEAATRQVVARVGEVLGPDWRVAVGRALRGATGVRSSFDQARDSLHFASRLGLPGSVLDPAQLALYRVLLRDRAAITDLIGTVLAPLTEARGGAAPLLETLEAYFASGANATRTAERLHLSVRAVTYRLARVAELLDRDPTDPAARFTLEAAVLGARLLDWPRVALEG